MRALLPVSLREIVQREKVVEGVSEKRACVKEASSTSVICWEPDTSNTGCPPCAAMNLGKWFLRRVVERLRLVDGRETPEIGVLFWVW